MSSFEDKNGIAIWWKHEEDVNQKPKIHLDIIVWNTVKRDDIDYIEFGIKVENFLKLKEISIYLPYDFKVEDIEDKSSFFNNKIFANALFNEKVILKSDEKDIYEDYYINGKRSGVFKYFSGKGALISFGEYKDGKEIGTWYFFHDKGYLVAIQKDFGPNTQK